MTTFAPSVSPEAVAKLRKTTELILADVNLWRQDVWGATGVTNHESVTVMPSDVGLPSLCGTAFCFAGHYLINVAGYHPKWSFSAFRLSPRGVENLAVPWGDNRNVALAAVMHGITDDSGAVLTDDHDDDGLSLRSNVSDFAARELDLDEVRANLLFAGHNSLRRIVELVYQFTAGEVDMLHVYWNVVENDPDLAERERLAEELANRRAVDAYEYYLDDLPTELSPEATAENVRRYFEQNLTAAM